MTDQTKSPSGQSAETSGQPANQETINDKKDMVAYESYQKLLYEKNKLRDEHQKLLNEKKVIDEKNLKEKEDYKALFETRDSELKRIKEEHDSLKESLDNSKKISALNSHLKISLEPKYFSLIDFEKITIDPTTNRPDPDSVKKYADDFRKEHTIFFTVPSQKMPHDGTPQNNGQGLAYEEWLKLSPKDQRKRSKEVIKK